MSYSGHIAFSSPQESATPRSIQHRLLHISFSLLLLTICLAWAGPSTARAQSGRKLPDWNKKKPDTPPDKDKDATDQPAQQEAPKPAIPLVVVRNFPDISTSTILTDITVDSCVKRLNESKGFTVSTDQNMNRKEASDRAKAMTNGYVVMIELDVDTMNPEYTGIGPVNPYYLYVSYIIFTGGTGKIKGQGHVYQRSYAGPGVGLPSPTSTAAEYRLQQAGRETADRILQSIGVAPLPTDRW